MAETAVPFEAVIGQAGRHRDQNARPALRILVADDFPVFRRGVKEILQEGLDAVTVGEVGTAHEVLDLGRRQTWDAVVLDITMPGTSGPGLVRELKRTRPAPPVLVLTMHPEEQYALRMLQAGADGYLTKTNASTELVAALKKILAGGTYVSAALAEQLASDVRMTRRNSLHETLSDREYEVLRLIATGKSPTAIAEELCLSVPTISTYRARLLQKLKLKNTAALIRYAIQHGHD